METKIETTTMYEVQQHTGYQWEPMTEGEFATDAEAIAAMEALEAEFGWRDLRVVKQILSEDGAAILDREVILAGQPSEEDA